jgi:Ca-activated chloride channel family protein
VRWLILALLLVGMARPQTQNSQTQIKASGIDIVIALDLSMSMAAEEFQIRGDRVNRVEMAQSVVHDFIKNRLSDRFGLVAFAGRAYVACPLTLDHDFFVTNLDRLRLGVLEDGTAIGSAIACGLNRLKDSKAKSKILILMTDGQNNAGAVPPLTAAEAAKALGVKIYTIGIGTHGMAPVPSYDVFKRKFYRDQPVDIDEDMLKKIAQATGGRYDRADQAEKFKDIYREIDRLEKTQTVYSKFARHGEVYPWFVAPAVGLLLLEILLTHTRWRKLP